MIDLPEATRTTVVKLCAGRLTEAQARNLYALGPEAVTFALLTLSAERRRDQATDPATPSGMVPVHLKATSSRRPRKPGRKNGHPGDRREPPATIHQRRKHILTNCPDCGGPLGPPSEFRTRLTEDIPEVEPVVTEHTIGRTWCPTCDKLVEAPVDAALPNATIGNHLLALTAWLHYGLGNTLAQIVAVLSCHLHFQLTPGGLVGMWHRLAEILTGWYEAIAEEARASSALHADETGWRVCGQTNWLWCFTNSRLTLYLIDACRGSPVLLRFFAEEFAGTLITDFWGAYNRLVVAARQVCLVHLLRELEKVERYHDTSADWPAFRKLLRRLLRDALRLKRREEIGAEHYAALKQRLEKRLADLVNDPWRNAHARRLCHRLRRHQHELFTFLEQADVPADNNHAEREIRPAVIMRKNILGNRSQNGAHTQAVLMTVYRTLKLRGHDPIKTIVAALGVFLRTGTLPPLPE